MKQIRVVRVWVSCIVAMCLLAFMYFVNHKMETLQPAEYVSSVGLYLIGFIVFVFAVNEVYRFLSFLEKKFR